MRTFFNLSMHRLLDNRILSADIPLPGNLSHAGMLYVLDNLEGTEKKVVNVSLPRRSMPQYILIEPCPMAVLERYGIRGQSVSAPLFNIQNLSLPNQ